MRARALLAAAVGLAAQTLNAQTLNAQTLNAPSLAARVSAVHDGIVLMTFASRPGVCGNTDGSGWSSAGSSGWNNGRGDCIPGPVRVSLGRSENTTVSVRTRVGGAWRAASPEVDLGVVSAPDAARYLVSLARTIGGRNAGDALAAATIADSVELSPELTRLVRDSDAPVETRKQALFWLGQTDVSTPELARIHDGLQPSSLREHFTFVMSQRREDAAVDKLIDVARHDADHEIRKQAMFWLGQSKNPKAYRFLQDILTR